MTVEWPDFSPGIHWDGQSAPSYDGGDFNGILGNFVNLFGQGVGADQTNQVLITYTVPNGKTLVIADVGFSYQGANNPVWTLLYIDYGGTVIGNMGSVAGDHYNPSKPLVAAAATVVHVTVTFHNAPAANSVANATLVGWLH